MAVPRGSRRARGQVQWRRAVADDPALAELRPVRQRNIRTCAHIWSAYASWADMTTRPGHAKVAELAGVTLGTVKMARRWLEAHGYLGTVSEGRSARYCRRQGTGPRINESAVFVLTVPRRRSQTRCAVQAVPATCPPSSDVVRKDSPRARGKVTSREDRAKQPPVKGVTPGWWKHLTRPFLAAGWTKGDILHAIDHEPSGKAYQHLRDTVRHPVPWLRWRLGQWLDAGGTPGPSRSQRLAEAAERAKAAEAAREAERQAQAARAVDATPHATSIREQLGWARKPVRVTRPVPRLLAAVVDERMRPPVMEVTAWPGQKVGAP